MQTHTETVTTGEIRAGTEMYSGWWPRGSAQKGWFMRKKLRPLMGGKEDKGCKGGSELRCEPGAGLGARL